MRYVIALVTGIITGIVVTLAVSAHGELRPPTLLRADPIEEIHCPPNQEKHIFCDNNQVVIECRDKM
jgi:hypothetical protein